MATIAKQTLASNYCPPKFRMIEVIVTKDDGEKFVYKFNQQKNRGRLRADITYQSDRDMQDYYYQGVCDNRLMDERREFNLNIKL